MTVLHPRQNSADLLDQVLVATPFDGIVQKEWHTVLAVCEYVVVPAGTSCYRRGEDPLKGTIKGADFCHVIRTPQCSDPIRVVGIVRTGFQRLVTTLCLHRRTWTPQPALAVALDAEPSVKLLAAGVCRGGWPSRTIETTNSSAFLLVLNRLTLFGTRSSVVMLPSTWYTALWGLVLADSVACPSGFRKTLWAQPQVWG